MPARPESGNSPLRKARKDRFDEFYTQKKYIEQELRFYRNPEINPAIFADKTVYCNCDDPEQSEFWKYFECFFAGLKLRKLIATCHRAHAGNYVYEMALSSKVRGNSSPEARLAKIPLCGDGDFRSGPCAELLKEADIVVTNPPFSLFREYFAQLMRHGKKFLVIGSINAATYKEIFPYLRRGDVWLGRHSGPMDFFVPESYAGSSFRNRDGRKCARLGNICWFTNLDVPERHAPLNLPGRPYSPELYPKYDNYDAIEVSKVADIPLDYGGVMGVPLSYLPRHCPSQFEIIGLLAGHIRGLAGIPCKNGREGPYLNGKLKYGRILIRKREA